jgi:molybdenum cofactor guanylyltransferase
VNASAIILAGGQSARMGTDKALLMMDGESLLDRTIARLNLVSDEVIVVGRAYVPSGGARWIRDEIESVGPLGGLLSGLIGARHRYVICVGCDQPFLDADLLRYLASLAGDSDAVVPRIAGSSHPLHAVYDRDITAAARKRIETGEYSVRRFLDTIRVRWVDESEIDVFDPEHRSFLNVNTPEQWREVIAEAALGRI